DYYCQVWAISSNHPVF
nr:immunoglobulin light chain junction region [Macaca mulatta]